MLPCDVSHVIHHLNEDVTMRRISYVTHHLNENATLQC